MPRSETYARHLDEGFANWKLEVGGMVDAPAAFSLAELQAMPSRTQITRHDCVEGWSAIGQWTGTPLAHVLDTVRLKPDARFIVFHCADEFTINLSRDPYYESVDLIDAFLSTSRIAAADDRRNATTSDCSDSTPMTL